MDIFEKVKSLNLPIGEYVVFGSGPLAAHGIRKTRDIDLFITNELYQKLKTDGWEEKKWSSGEPYLAKDEIEAVNNWEYGEYNPAVNEMIGKAEMIQGIPFVSLEEVIKWKLAFGRPKDLKDIELINQYLTNKNSIKILRP